MRLPVMQRRVRVHDFSLALLFRWQEVYSGTSSTAILQRHSNGFLWWQCLCIPSLPVLFQRLTENGFKIRAELKVCKRWLCKYVCGPAATNTANSLKLRWWHQQAVFNIKVPGESAGPAENSARLIATQSEPSGSRRRGSLCTPVNL